jgi:hypothetical protein
MTDVLDLFEGLDPDQARELRQRILDDAIRARDEITRPKTVNEKLRAEVDRRRSDSYDKVRAAFNRSKK